MTKAIPSRVHHAGAAKRADDAREDAAARNRALVPFIPLSGQCFSRRGAPLAKAKAGDAALAAWEEVAATLPAESFRPDAALAARQLVLCLGFVAAAWTVLALLPWYLLPAGWALAGFAAQGLLVIGRDCANHSWLPSRVACDVFQVAARVPTMTTVHGSGDATLALGLAFGGSITYALGVGALFKFWVLPLLAFLVWSTMFANLAEVAPEEAVSSRGFLHSVSAGLPAPLSALVAHVDLSVRPSASLGPVPSYRMPAALDALRAPGAWTAQHLSQVSLLRPQTLLELGTRHLTVTGDTDAPPAPTFGEFFRRLYWLHIFILTAVPALGFYGIHTTESYDPRTVVWALVYYFATGFGITLGYHRLWSHKALDLDMRLQYPLAALAAGSVQGSAVWWCRGHRAHHRYTDTRLDPYNANGGFWYAHIGWMLVHPKRENYGRCDVSDLKRNPALAWQHKYYLPLVAFMALILPSAVAGLLWGDWRGGFFLAGVLRLNFVHHSTFCVNSVAHWFGDHTFDDEETPRDHIVTAFLTLGEGYHNFHHAHSHDYRNGIRWYDYDPTKWAIQILAYFNYATNLQVFPTNEIEKGRLNMAQKRLDQARARLRWPAAADSLPAMTAAEVRSRAKAGESLVIVDGFVHDVEEFVPRHPGGEAILKGLFGADATDAFHGGVYKHSAAARYLLTNFRVARLAHEEGDDK